MNVDTLLQRISTVLKPAEAKQVAKWVRPHLKKAKKKATAKKTLEWGFKRVRLGLDGFKALFKSIGAPLKPQKITKKYSTGGTSDRYHWKGRSVTIVTNDNPITGEFERTIVPDHIGYAHYVGITGKSAAVKRAVSYIKRHNAYRQWMDESPGKRGYI